MSSLSRRHWPFGLRPVLKIRRSESREQQRRRVSATTLLLALLFASFVPLQKFVETNLSFSIFRIIDDVESGQPANAFQ